MNRGWVWLLIRLFEVALVIGVAFGLIWVLRQLALGEVVKVLRP